MPHSDETHYPLISKSAPPRGRRSISARDYALPKPYRKKKYVEDEPEMSKLRVGLLTFSALVVASLVGALVLLASEDIDRRPVLVVGAPKEPAVRPVALPDPAPALMARPRPPVARAPIADRPRRQDPVHAAPFPLATPAKLARAPRVPPKPEAAAPVPAPDPDVVLITAILLLTPPNPPADPALAACSVSPANDGGCPALHGMKP